MKLEPDFAALAWLEKLIPETETFDWDDGNIDKNRKHGIPDEEIESLLNQDEYIFAGEIIKPAHPEWRGLILGQSDEGRFLALFTKRGEKLRPISCRLMRKEERRFYEKTVQKKD
ncbi:MAG: BrnT family toxin [Elusimicrobia bacterium]|nr:BrnT family toxin [Elusimicrobiota bacterium]